MAAVMLGAVAGVTVRETLRSRYESMWLRQYALDPPVGQMLVVDSLFALRRYLDQHLRVQLSFFVKVKFDLEACSPRTLWRSRGSLRRWLRACWRRPPPAPTITSSSRRRGTLTRTLIPTSAWPRSWRGRASSWDEHLESARLRNSRELIGGIKHIYLLVGPARR